MEESSIESLNSLISQKRFAAILLIDDHGTFIDHIITEKPVYVWNKKKVQTS
jgi:hypothetical protein